MAVYAVVQVDVTDDEAYGAYAKLAGPAVEKYDGEFLARGGRVEVMEGTTRSRCVIIRFANLETAKAFYHSPEYQEALSHARDASERELMVVETSA